MISQKAIVIAEDNEGHATLIKRNLRRGKVRYPIIHLKDGEETLNFFTRSGEGPHMERGVEYVLLLDINMPKINGIEILRELRNNHEFINLPIIMVTTTNNPTEIEKCYSLGCSNYIAKHVDYHEFSNKIKELGKYIHRLEAPLAS